MRAAKIAVLVLIAVLISLSGWLAYRAVKRTRAATAQPLSPTPAQNTEPPVVEFREVRSGPAGQTGSLLTIDRGGQATLQTLPLGSENTTKRTRLSCDELAWLPQQMKLELAELQSNYGAKRGPNEGELSVVSRWEGRERRVVWRNPESSPKPPEGYWAGLVAPLEDIRRRAEEPAQTWPLEDAIIGYGKISEGVVGTYSYSLLIDKSGHAVLRGGLGWAGYAFRGETQLAPQELSALVRAFEEARFSDFQRCYGRHAPVNRQNTSLFYVGGHSESSVTWMTEGSDPKPPDGWFRIVKALDDVWARAEKGAEIRQALYLIAEHGLDPVYLSVTYDDMNGLWGALTLTIHGNGHVKQKAVKVQARSPTRVSRAAILKLARLLLEEKAWEQREPERSSKPDESKARLIVEYGHERSEIWEWYSDLDKNHRLEKIRGQMKSIASQ